MILFKDSRDLRSWLEKEQHNGRKTGFVPTMGALHEGHIQLIEASRLIADDTVCSIFINPAQFNNAGDFEKYPVSIEKDILMLEKAQNGVLFLPSVKEVYPDGTDHLEHYDLAGLDSVLEGEYRPGHFQGVCQVMSRLLKLVRPDHLIMGQKDFQQCLVVRRLIQILKLPIEFHAVPTVRESDGLAQSSRNRRLSSEQRARSVAIFNALNEILKNIKPGDLSPLIQSVQKILDDADFKTDYISISGASDLKPIRSWDGKQKAVALIAAFQGEVRLIDNMLIN